MRTRISLILSAAVLFSTMSALGAAPAAVGAVTTLTATADAAVQADQPGVNFGTSPTLRVDGSPISVAYLKFDVQGIPAAPTRATLKVWLPVATSTPITAGAVADTAWSETGLTYANRPAVAPPAIAPGSLIAGSYMTYDVTGTVTGNGLVSFALSTTSTASKSLPSRENATAGQRPLLEIETGGTTPPPTPPALNPVADADVRADQAAANFGTSTTLRVDGSPISVAYLKFDIQGLTAPPSRATLKVFVPTSTSTSINAGSVADTAWTETGLTYANRPAVSAPIPSAVPIAANSFVSFDVTSRVSGNGVVSFAIDTASSTSKSLPSRENPIAANRPQLVLETGSPPTTTPATTTPPPPTTPPVGAGTVLAIAGDVACGPSEAGYNGGAGTVDKCHMRATSELILAMAPERVLAPGDLQYNSGALADFMTSYDASWGRFRSITHPAVGNHEYGTSGARGYFTYFGDAATPRQPGCTSNCEGYYSFDVGGWHVAVINSECTRINGGTGCAVGSPQYLWLDQDLASSAAACTIVLSHRPRWSSSSFASPDIQPLVEVMYARNVDLLIAGHAHSFERFVPQDAAAQPDEARGIRAITVGTGGRDSQGFGTVLPNSVVRKNKIFGVLKLTLRTGAYDWSFVADPATPFTDTGNGTCH